MIDYSLWILDLKIIGWVGVVKVETFVFEWTVSTSLV